MIQSFTTGALLRLEELGLSLPSDLPPPAGSYAPYRLLKGMGFLAAQTPGYDQRFQGQVGRDLSLEEGRAAAQLTALNSLARIHQALGGFDRLVGLGHVAGHVCSAPDFFDQPEVLDGASQLFNVVLGDRGQHSRTAYAAIHLPKHISIELEITFVYEEE